LKLLVGLKGSAEDLNLTGADLYRLPNASFFAGGREGEVDPIDGSDHETDPSVDVATLSEDLDSMASNPNEGILVPRTRRSKAARKVVYEAGKSWMHVTFPSAKDPSFTYRHGNVTTCVVTVEAGDDFVVLFDTKPKVYSIKKEADSSAMRHRLVDQITSDLIRYFPQLDGKQLFTKTMQLYTRLTVRVFGAIR
jgi:hypothetical protein